MPTIFYTPEKEQPWARKGSTTFNGVRLEPGINTLSEEQFKVLMEHPDYTKYVSWGAISTPAEELPLFARTSTTDTSDFIPKNIVTEIPSKTTRKKTTAPSVELELTDE
jgi:hypothetical protein